MSPTTNHPAKCWCFTQPDPYDQFAAGFPSEIPCSSDLIAYMVIGREVGSGETAYRHLQGYIVLTEKKRLAQVKEILGWPTVHLEKRKAKSHKEAVDYCKKDGAFHEWGMLPHEERGRTDLQAAKDFLLSGHTIEELMLHDELGEVYAKYPRYCAEVLNAHRSGATKRKRLELYNSCVLRPWQKELEDKLIETPDTRTIFWYFDTAGKTGKSFMGDYLSYKLNAFYTTGGKLLDLAYAYGSEPIVCIDLSRTQADKIDHLYAFAEMLKNGRIFSGKYQSTNKVFDTPHVVFFANFEPNYMALSTDRWSVVDLGSVV